MRVTDRFSSPAKRFVGCYMRPVASVTAIPRARTRWIASPAPGMMAPSVLTMVPSRSMEAKRYLNVICPDLPALTVLLIMPSASPSSLQAPAAGNPEHDLTPPGNETETTSLAGSRR